MVPLLLDLPFAVLAPTDPPEELFADLPDPFAVHYLHLACAWAVQCKQRKLSAVEPLRYIAAFSRHAVFPIVVQERIIPLTDALQQAAEYCRRRDNTDAVGSASGLASLATSLSAILTAMPRLALEMHSLGIVKRLAMATFFELTQRHTLLERCNAGRAGSAAEHGGLCITRQQLGCMLTFLLQLCEVGGGLRVGRAKHGMPVHLSDMFVQDFDPRGCDLLRLAAQLFGACHEAPPDARSATLDGYSPADDGGAFSLTLLKCMNALVAPPGGLHHERAVRLAESGCLAAAHWALTNAALPDDFRIQASALLHRCAYLPGCWRGAPAQQLMDGFLAPLLEMEVRMGGFYGLPFVSKRWRYEQQ